MLAYIVLALLARGADHGYRIGQRLEEKLYPVWRINAGQVYQILGRLRRAKWVEELPPETYPPHGRASWPVAITPEGRRALRLWLTRPTQPNRAPPLPRNEILGQILLGDRANFTNVLTNVKTEQIVYEAELKRVRALRSQISGEETPRRVAQSLAIEASVGNIKAHLAWLEKVRRTLASTVA